ncbi:MerR family transcriptional regulator [Amycolatopsis antarctica]|uniref:MerR family transcriptional regulator n=1 Tax=Amycolatopsis antarctica TaxID=1854586 RepID=A0A263D770_9PSEU|nr:MerR family transcriptional regulator [Amycolatopsis antarctica]OZM74362.1 MerR family transcriptional regulator [Amycolatopsis antarctica]
MATECRALRPIDLARAAGISVQQVRNYADAGLLPPAPRSPSGYRRFDARHRDALLTYRALARGYGPATARAIMWAVHDGDVSRALTIVDEGHALLHRQREDLAAAAGALEAVAEQVPPSRETPRTGLRIGEVASLLRLRASALRVWEDAGLLTPRREHGTKYRSYGPADVRDARMIAILRQSHYPLAQIRPVLDGLRESGSSAALRDAIARRGQALTSRSAAVLGGDSRLHAYLGQG